VDQLRSKWLLLNWSTGRFQITYCQELAKRDVDWLRAGLSFPSLHAAWSLNTTEAVYSRGSSWHPRRHADILAGILARMLRGKCSRGISAWPKRLLHLLIIWSVSGGSHVRSVMSVIRIWSCHLIQTICRWDFFMWKDSRFLVSVTSTPRVQVFDGLTGLTGLTIEMCGKTKRVACPA